MIVKDNNEIYSTTDKFIHIKGTDSYAKLILGIGISEDMCEEVDEIPTPFSEDEYNKSVEDRIRQKYSLSEELAILRQRDTKQEEFAAYFSYCEDCKADARAEIQKNAENNCLNVV